MTTHPDLTTAAAYLDEAMKAIALAKQALLGGAGGALFVSSGPDLAAAEASPGNPYGSIVGSRVEDAHDDSPSPASGTIVGRVDGETLEVLWDGEQEPIREPFDGLRPEPGPYGSTKHGEFTAGSAAEVAEGVEPTQCPGFCMAATPTRYGHATVCCTLPAGHDGDHVAKGTGNPPGSWAEGKGIDWEALERVQGFAQDLCPAQWGEPPETMLCSLASGHDGNHATAEGVEWGGRWETAEPHGGAR